MCQDKICRNGVGCGNRFVTMFSFDLIGTRVGIGTAARCRIPSDGFLLEFVGELIYGEEMENRPPIHKDDMLPLPVRATTEKNVFIDPTLKEIVERFVNHSCRPNCEFRTFQCGR